MKAFNRISAVVAVIIAAIFVTVNIVLLTADSNYNGRPYRVEINRLALEIESGSFETVSLLTGPEGGLEEKEVEQARNAGLQVCTLGSRILRCETAPLCALSAVMYAAGEF